MFGLLAWFTWPLAIMPSAPHLRFKDAAISCSLTYAIAWSREGAGTTIRKGGIARAIEIDKGIAAFGGRSIQRTYDFSTQRRVHPNQ